MGRLFTVLPLLGIILAAGCASTDWEARYLEKETESRALQEQYDSLNQRYAERDAMSHSLEGELAKTKSVVDVLAAQVDDLKNVPVPVAPNPANDEVARLQAEVDRLRQQYPDQPIRVTEEGNIEITLNSEVTFRAGSYELSTQGKKILDGVSAEIDREFPGHTVMVVGHTDTDPIKKSPFKDNLELGAERSAEVVRYFAKSHGMDPSLLVAASRGSTAPIADNSTKEGRKKNRRVEIVVVIPRSEILDAFSMK